MSRSTLLILSGAYIDQELAAEFGPLPPSFLPVGMRRLFEMQLELFSKLDGEVDVFLTLPADFEPCETVCNVGPLYDRARTVSQHIYVFLD